MKILIVEDEVNIANLFKKSLEAVGHEVMMAHNGPNGLKMAEIGNFEVIILDIMLPGMNGFEVTKSLRKKHILTPIIILTARDTIDDKKNSFAAGANDYLVKPVGLGLLLERIEKITNAGGQVFGLKESNANMTGKKPKLTAKYTSQPNKPEKMPSTIQADTSAPDNMSQAENFSIEVTALNKNIMDHAPMSIITINKEGFVTSANKFFKKIKKSNKIVNLNIFTSKFFVKENLADEYRNLLANGTPIKKNRCHEKNSKGEDMYLKIIATPIYDNNGNIEGALSMAIDNTEEVTLKNNLVNLNKNLEQNIKERTIELNDKNEELKKVLKIKSAFAADVSHEMRTSLAIIQGNLELMTRTKAIQDHGLDSSEQIFQEINRISGMLSNLTSLTNADSASQKLNYSKVNLDEMIESICNSLKVVADEKNVTIEHKNCSTSVDLMADKAKLEELLLNLIRNAIKYNKNDGWIKICSNRISNKVCIKIEDSGIGISKKHLPYIFERFYRIDSARTRNSGGSGLGLSICKWIVEIHGGKIVATSKPGVGSIFTTHLPIDSQKQAIQAKLDI